MATEVIWAEAVPCSVFLDERLEPFPDVGWRGRPGRAECRRIRNGVGDGRRIEPTVRQHQVATCVAPGVDLRIRLAGPGERGEESDK